MKSDLIGLSEARRRFGVSPFFLKQHLEIVNLGYRTKLVRASDVEALIDRMTVGPNQQRQAAVEPRPRRSGTGRKRDLLG